MSHSTSTDTVLTEMVAFLQTRPFGVVATRGEAAPEAAVIGIVTADEQGPELFFDTLKTSRKWQNLQRDGRLAMVVGWDLDDARTIQLEGVADEPGGADLARLLTLYLTHFPDGRERQQMPDIAYIRVRPTWLRLSDFRSQPPALHEVTPIGTTWDSARDVLETRLTGRVEHSDVERWKQGLAAELGRIADGTPFKLLSDMRTLEPVSLDVHKAMREVVPRLLAAHGMRPAFIDLFDEAPEVTVVTTRDVRCTAFANVHQDPDKMADYQHRIGRDDQRFFTSRVEAEVWLESRA